MSAILRSFRGLIHAVPSAAALAALGLIASSAPESPEIRQPPVLTAPHYGSSGKIVDRLDGIAPAVDAYDGRLVSSPNAAAGALGSMPEFVEAASRGMLVAVMVREAAPATTATATARPLPVRPRPLPVVRKPSFVAVLPPPRSQAFPKPEPAQAVAAVRKPSASSRMLALVTAFGGSLSSLVKSL